MTELWHKIRAQPEHLNVYFKDTFVGFFKVNNFNAFHKVVITRNDGITAFESDTTARSQALCEPIDRFA